MIPVPPCLRTTLAATLLAAAGLCAAPARATIVTFDILQLSHDADPLGSQYAGTGYVGLYQDSFNGVFGIENWIGFESRTALQVDVSSLAGATIHGARLDYSIVHSTGPQAVQLEAFTSTGVLGHAWNPANVLLAGLAPSDIGDNSLDVTDYLQQGLAANTGWFGLWLAATDQPQWTSANRSGEPDGARVRLTVDFEAPSTTVPEPMTLGLVATGLLALALSRRPRADSAAHPRP